MLDRAARRLVDPILQSVAARAADLRLNADQVTIVGFGFGLAAIVAIAVQAYFLGLVLLLLNRLADGVDGCLARRSGPTDLGAYLDIVLDFIVYSGAAFAFALAMPEDALAAAFLIFSFMGTGSSFLAFAIFAAKRSLPPGVSFHGLKLLGGEQIERGNSQLHLLGKTNWIFSPSLQQVAKVIQGKETFIHKRAQIKAVQALLHTLQHRPGQKRYQPRPIQTSAQELLKRARQTAIDNQEPTEVVAVKTFAQLKFKNPAV